MVSLFRFKLLYFVQFSSYGVVFPYMPIFFESLGMSKSQIGILSMIPNVSCFMVGPIFSFIGDKFKAHGEVLIFTLLTSTVTTIAMYYMDSFQTQLPLVLLSSIFKAPIGPEIDSLVMASLEDKTTYGSMRLWGAVSFGIFSFVGGVLSTSTATGSEDNPFLYLFYTSAVCTILSGFIILSLLLEEAHVHPSTEKKKKRGKGSMNRENSSQTLSTMDESSVTGTPFLPTATASSNAPRGMHVDSAYKSIDSLQNDSEQSEGIVVNRERSESVGSEERDEDEEGRKNIVATLYQVFRTNPAVLVFAVVVFLSGFGAGAIDSYLFLHLKELGGTGLIMGIARFITCAAEVPMFEVSGGLQKKYGTWVMISITQIAFVVRFMYYSLLTNPWAVLPCEVLNGLTFAVTWSVSCTYANEISPPGCQAVMQALLEGLHFGIGCGVGSLVGGYMYEYYGAVILFQFCAFLSACSTVLALVAWRICRDAPKSCAEDNTTEPATVQKKVAIGVFSSESKSKSGIGAGGYLELQQIEDGSHDP